MRPVLLIAGLLLGSCDVRSVVEPTARSAGTDRDQQREAAGNARIDADPCARRTITRLERRTIPVIASFRPRDCLAFLPARVMRGVWYKGFEESSFVPDVDDVPRHREIGSGSGNSEFDIFLDIDADEALRRMGARECRGTCAYAIMFVGRRSREAQNIYTGQGTYVVAVNAVLNGRLLGRIRTRACLGDQPCVDIE